MSLVVEAHFQHILRMLNTNIDGRQKIMYALTSIRGIGRRFSNLVCKKADIDMTKRYFSLSFTLRRVIKPELLEIFLFAGIFCRLEDLEFLFTSQINTAFKPVHHFHLFLELVS